MALGSKTIDMTEGKLTGKLLAFALPLMLSGILQCLYNAADTAIMGSVDVNAVGAVGSTSALINLLVNLFISLSVGTGVTVAVAIGAKDEGRVQRLLYSSIGIALICGAVITVVGICFSRTFLIWMDTNELLLDEAVEYLRIYFMGSVFSMVYNFGAAVLRSAGDSRRPLYFLAISGAVNVIFNMIFVLGCHMRVAGVAWATVISQALSAIMVTVALFRHTGMCRFRLSRFRFYKKETGDVLKTGLPAAIQSLIFSFANTIIQSSVNSFDNELVVAGNTAASNIEAFIYNGMYAYRATSVTAVGQNLGAGKIDRIPKIMRTCLLMVTVTGIVLGGIAILFAKPLLGIFLQDSPTAMDYGYQRLILLAATYFLCGIMDTAVGFSQGMGNTLLPMIVSVSGVCGVRIVWLLCVFPHFHTPIMLYLAFTLSWIVTGAGQFIISQCIYRRLKRRTDALRAEKPTETAQG